MLRDGFLRGALRKGDVERNRVVDNEPLSSKSSFFLSSSRYGFIRIHKYVYEARTRETSKDRDNIDRDIIIIRDIIGDFDWTTTC